MTNEEILNEVKSTFRLEGVEISSEQEERIIKYLSDKASFDDLLMELYKKYSIKNYK